MTDRMPSLFKGPLSLAVQRAVSRADRARRSRAPFVRPMVEIPPHLHELACEIVEACARNHAVLPNTAPRAIFEELQRRQATATAADEQAQLRELGITLGRQVHQLGDFYRQTLNRIHAEADVP
jgi:hypothetical protein